MLANTSVRTDIGERFFVTQDSDNTETLVGSTEKFGSPFHVAILAERKDVVECFLALNQDRRIDTRCEFCGFKSYS